MADQKKLIWFQIIPASYMWIGPKSNSELWCIKQDAKKSNLLKCLSSRVLDYTCNPKEHNEHGRECFTPFFRTPIVFCWQSSSVIDVNGRYFRNSIMAFCPWACLFSLLIASIGDCSSHVPAALDACPVHGSSVNAGIGLTRKNLLLTRSHLLSKKNLNTVCTQDPPAPALGCQLLPHHLMACITLPLM